MGLSHRNEYLTRVLIERERQRADGRSLVSLGEHISMNPLLIVQRALGHASPHTTYGYRLPWLLEDFAVGVGHHDALGGALWRG